MTFLLFLGWIFLARNWYSGGSQAAWTSLGFMVLLFACVLAHEFGHIFMARRFGVTTPTVTLLPIGGVAQLERIPEKPSEEFLVAIAGPLVNVVIAAVLVIFFGASLDRATYPEWTRRRRPHARPAGGGEHLPGGVQPDPGVSDGRRARAARAAREQLGLRGRPRSRPRSDRWSRSASASSACSAIRC